MASTRPHDITWTNDILQRIVDEAEEKGKQLNTQLETARELNLRRDFDKFVASGQTLPKWQPTDHDLSPGKRFSTTSSEYTTQETFKNMPSPNILRKNCADRKAANWNAQIDFGSEPIEYMTDARRSGAAADNVEGFRASMNETAKSRIKAKELKKNLSRTQWQLGPDPDSLANATASSILPDPTGPEFSSYRGVLDREVEAKIRRSVAFEGCLDPAYMKPTYKTVMSEGCEHLGNAMDFKSVNAASKKLKLANQNSQVAFGDGKFRGMTTDYREGFKVYDTKAMENSKGVLDKELVKSLRASTIRFGDGMHRHMITDQQHNSAIFNEAVKEQKESGRDDLKNIKLSNATIKARLIKTTYKIGDDRNYMS